MAAMMRGELLDDFIDALAAAEEEDGLRAALAEAEAATAVATANEAGEGAMQPGSVVTRGGVAVSGAKR